MISRPAATAMSSVVDQISQEAAAAQQKARALVAELTRVLNRADSPAQSLEIQEYLGASGLQVLAEAEGASAGMQAFKALVLQRFPGFGVFGMPTEEQMEQINRCRPQGRSPYTPDEITTFGLLAIHNLLSLDAYRYDEASLEKFARLATNKPYIADHNWDDAMGAQGFIYDAKLINTGSVAPDEIVNAAGQGEVNQRILAAHGFSAVLCAIALPSGSSCEQATSYGKIRCCSIGGIADMQYSCGDCSLDRGELVSYQDKHCPHLPPLWYFKGDPDIELSTHYIKSGLHTATELSACVQGAFPGAGILAHG